MFKGTGFEPVLDKDGNENKMIVREWYSQYPETSR
jgi:hypothetical protein